MEFDISRGRIRPWQTGDEEALAQHANNHNISRNLRDSFPHPYTIADARAYIQSRHEATNDLSLAIEVDREAVGGIGLHPRSDVARLSAEIGYWLGEPHWGRGIMTEAVRTLTLYGLGKRELVRIFAHVFQGNQASMRVLEKAGYTLEGRLRKAVFKDGQIIDEFIYARVRSR